MADKIKKQDFGGLNDKNMRNMIIKLEDIKKENIKLKEKLLNPQKSEKITKVEPMVKTQSERSKTPTRAPESRMPVKEDMRPVKDLRGKSRNKEVKEESKPQYLEVPKSKLISMASIGKDINEFDDIRKATLNRLKTTTLDAIGSKENEIKSRYVKRIEEIKPHVDKLHNLIHKFKEEKYVRITKNCSSIFEGFEGTVSKKNEMFFKKMFLMHVDLMEDYDVYYKQLNNFQSLSSDFQKFNVI